MTPFFEFTVDKAAKTIHITREFDAGIDLVWDAFTKAEILDQWTAPKPYRSVTKEMNFTVGGRWLYAMVSPENVSRWSMVEFLKIDPKTSFTGRNSFSDENGNTLDGRFSITTNAFKEDSGKTTVYITKQFQDLAVLEMMAVGGFKEGTEEGMRNLDEIFRARGGKK